MKNKAKLIISMILLSLTIMIILTACGHEHSYGEWTTEKEATCTENGSKVRICECGEKETEIIPSLGHTDGEWITDKEPTCTEEGSKHQECSVCSETIKTEILEVSNVHTDGIWITDKEPTCTEDGSKHQICSVCNKTIRTETLMKLGHTEVVDKAVAATCTKTGLTEGKHCSLCNTVTVAQTTTKAKGHTEVVDKAVAATCTKTGLTEGKHCSVCNAVTVEQKTVKAKGHTEGKWIIDKEATCSADGSKHQICSVCSKTIKTEAIAKLDHTYQVSSMENNGVVGSKIIYTCTNCTESYEKTIEEIVVSVQLTGTSSATINGYGSYSKSYAVSATGGYGSLQYKFEVYTSVTASKPSSNLTKDFSSDNTYGISYRGYENAISGYILQVTVKDEAGNQTIYRYEF